MIKKSYIRYAVAALFATASIAGNAFAFDEMERNDLITLANTLPLDGPGSVEIKGVVGVRLTADTLINDIDFYKFEGRKGDVVTLDIDGGVKSGNAERSPDTMIALFNATFKKIAESFDSTLDPLDPGSIGSRDAYLGEFTLPADGTYYVGVTAQSFGRMFSDGGRLSTASAKPATNGAYTLIVTEKSAVLAISIDVKPGNDEPAPFNPKSKGNIPVAILSSSGPQPFDAMKIKVESESLTFGATGTEQTLERCNKDGTDVNGDGLLDRVCHFNSQGTRFTIDHAMGILRGKTDGGEAFEGSGMLKILPTKHD
jgi:hypothetical protein